MSDAKQRTAKPGDLLSQWWTLGAIAADRRTTGRHMKAGWVIINSYWQKHGNGRASLSYIQRATGMDRKTVIRACRELDEWGHAARATGVGSRPSEYVPRWVTTVSGVQAATTNDDAPSGVQMTTTLVVESTPLDRASSVQMTTESYLPEPAYLPASGEVENDCGAATPPPVDGLAATTAGTPQDDLQHSQATPTFEALWRAYAYAKGKKEARTAWDALPAEVDKAAVAEAAKAWQASWAAQGKPDAPRKHLATWLREERYDEDAPTGYQPKEKRAKPANPTARGKASPSKRNPVRTTARVTSADVETTGDVTELRIVATDAGGYEHERIIPLEHYDAETQFEGQRRFASLVCAAGLEQVSDSPEFLGRTIILTEDGFAAPTNRPDDEPPLPVKPEPVPYANPAPVKAEESPAAFAERMAKSLEGRTWPEWMDSEYEEDDAA